MFEGSARAEGDSCGVEFGVEVGFFAEVLQVGGEAVADVDAGGGEFSAQECLSGSETGLREEVRVGCWIGQLVEGSRIFGQGREFSGCSPEGAGDVEDVSGASCGAEECAAFGDCADDDDVGYGEGGRFGEIAAGEGDVFAIGEGEQAGVEAVDPMILHETLFGW